MKRAIIYTRVSTDEQKEKGFSLLNQKEQLIKYCCQNNIEILKHFEEDYSAKNFDRPIFKELLEFAKEHKKKIDLLLVTRWDRFSRNLLDSLLMINDLKKSGIEVVTLEQPKDMDSDSYKLMKTIHLLFAEIDNDNRAKSTREGSLKARREGYWLGGAPTGYEHCKTDNNKPTIRPNSKAALVREAYEEYAKGVYSMEELRKRLNKKGINKSGQAFNEMMKNVAYIGLIHVNKYKKDEEPEIVKGFHEPILLDELFYKVQEIIQGRRRIKKRQPKLDERWPLKAHLKCKICGRNLTASETSKPRHGKYYHYYHCQYRCRERFRVDEANKEFLKYLSGLKIKPEIKELYKLVLTDIYKEKEGDKIAEVKNIIKKINEFETMLQKLEDKFINDKIDIETYNRVKTRYLAEKSELEIEKTQLEQIDTSFIKYLNFGLSLFENLNVYYSKASIEVKDKFLSSIFPDRLIYSEKKYLNVGSNELINLITCNSNVLKEVKNEKAGIISGRYEGVAPTGVEPVSTV